MIKKLYLLLASIFVFSSIVHSVPFLTEGRPVGIDSYYFLRIGNLMADSGFNLASDPLSFGGRAFTYPGGLPYLAGFLAAAGSIEIGGIIATLIAGSLSGVLIFLIALELMKKERRRTEAAFFSAVLFSLVPVVIWKASATLMSPIFVMFLFLLSIWLLVNEGERKFFIIPALLLAAFSPAFALLISAAALIYFERSGILTKIGILAALLASAALALMYFSSFFDIYVSKSLPSRIYEAIYPSLSVAGIAYLLNPFVLLIGISSFIFIGWRFLSAKKEHFQSRHALMIVITLVFVAMLFMKWVEPDRGLFFLAVPMSIASGYLLAKMRKPHAYVIYFIIFALSLFIATYAYADLHNVTATKEEAGALMKLKEISNENSVVLSSEAAGSMVSYYSGRKNFMDGNLIGAPDLTGRFSDAEAVYTGNSSTRQALLEKDGITHIFLSRWEKYKFGAEKAILDSDPGLMVVIEEGDVVIYEVV